MEERKVIDPDIMKRLLREQGDEITAHHIYLDIAKLVKEEENKEIIQRIAVNEKKHYEWLKILTGRDVKMNRWKRFFYVWVIRIFGLTFGIKLLEKDEIREMQDFKELGEEFPGFDEILLNGEQREQELIDMIDEDRLRYMGSVVLGLNDALIELTGALAGYTFAFQNTKLIAVTGLITGISGSLSMIASQYLSSRQEGGRDAVKSMLYTGSAFVLTVISMVSPFFIFKNPYISLATTFAVAIFIIFIFNYYISVAKGYVFKKRFFEMAAISLGVAGISFIIGMIIKRYIGLDI
ncbi:VIT1/CCC1 transporter family protein [Gottschalkiaceae bacterium SANA]|nr:VIT1/CCC1 transporter family protein [Gottschalkiaceae bacterium SANA]